MATNDDDLEINRELLGILDKLLADGKWDVSLFLQASGKKIKDLRDRIHDYVEKTEIEAGKGKQPDWLRKPMQDLRPRMPVEVYVGLYLTDGSNLQKWEHALDKLLARSSTRPIYLSEDDIKDTLKKNGAKPNDAYVAILIDKSDILSPGEHPPLDRYGHPLLMVKEHALNKSNIKQFEHLSGAYALKDDRLVKIEPSPDRQIPDT